ncbi:MAG: hypothetical protein Q4G49_02105 [Paracoccus sp. (in: a-proteobacteria)]|nr:hypothetical protein [Paracoccus sp. (in: a-proteobacteria)]
MDWLNADFIDGGRVAGVSANGEFHFYDGDKQTFRHDSSLTAMREMEIAGASPAIKFSFDATAVTSSA